MSRGLDSILADTLGGFAADALLRADHAEERGSINDFSETAFGQVIELAATAPGTGFLMIWAHLNAEYDFNSVDGADVDLDCRIAVDGEAVSIVVDQEFAKVEGGTNSGESIAVSTVTPVDSGSRTVALECRTTGAGAVFVKARSLSTLYVPFGSVTR